MAEAQPGGTEQDNPMARGRFVTEEGVLKLQYTTKSPSDVFEYTCKEKDGRLVCRDEPNLVGWCAALEAYEAGSCLKSSLEDLGARGMPDEKITEAIRTARAAREQAERAGGIQQFQLANNNLGNKLQSVVYIEIRPHDCRLQFTDNYRALYNGHWVEDSNVVGANPFNRAQGELLWEHCADVQSLVGIEDATLPAQLPAPKKHTVGTTLHYYYVGREAAAPEAGCTYAQDTYAQWRPVARNQAVNAVDGRLDWHTSQAWSDRATLALANPQSPTGVYTIVRKKTCGGTESTIDVVCTANFFE
jgi:hypothetical protein